MLFYSKKDNWLSILLWITVIILIYLFITSYMTGDLNMIEFMIISVLLLAISLFLLWSWFSTYYVLKDDHLLIKSGPFKKVIKYTSMKSLQKTANPLSGPAWSLQRIEIIYRRYSVTLVSPRNRDQFIEILKEKCPHIEVKPEAGFLKDH